MERFWSKVDATGPCWEWTRGQNSYGYGRFNVGGFVWLAHRYAWTILVGPIPDGMVVDHLCRNRLCVNPDHMELVTLAENKRRGASPTAINRRKTHCKNGHPFDETSIRADGLGRRCRICEREQQRMRNRRR